MNAEKGEGEILHTKQSVRDRLCVSVRAPHCKAIAQ